MDDIKSESVFLNGNAELYFLQWLRNSPYGNNHYCGNKVMVDGNIIELKFLQDAFIIELIKLWLESVGILVGTEICYDKSSKYVRGFDAWVCVELTNYYENTSLYNNRDVYDSRQTCKIESILHANQVFNSMKA